ncbi:sigma-70 family RNA polymerase sigma factor [Paraglaciecola sp.]|uniref:sigma-70 family RNA polymerase sigma factor n=1 Tax=Paraglaciecola sp. TaxID=1920173 RepID=UPI00273EF482|nr:sigma-70 family RNA polymerase sigma factor [Paraglaciecola sp.]MDP5031407.1 sigma-70 family RNA polymerase sigma factor [Paraglaciecola sp.]
MSEEEITNLIKCWQNDEAPERDILLALAYQFIKDMSANHYSNLPEDANTHLLCQTSTDLAHDVYIKLKKSEQLLPIESVRQFYAYINVTVRNCFLDSYRSSSSTKYRPSSKTTLTSTNAINQIGSSVENDVELWSISTQLETLGIKYPRAAEVIELRYYSQLQNKEIARMLNISVRTVENDLHFAKIWLSKNLA